MEARADGPDTDSEIGARAARLPWRLRGGVAVAWVERVARPHGTGALAPAWNAFRAASDALWAWTAGLPPRRRLGDVAEDWVAACELLPAPPPCAAAMSAALEVARESGDASDGERATMLMTTVLSLCRRTLEEVAPWLGPVRWELTDAAGSGEAQRAVPIPLVARDGERRRNALRFEEVRVEFAFQGCVLAVAEGIAAQRARIVARAELIEGCAAGPARFLRLRPRRGREIHTTTVAEQLTLF